MDFKQIKELIDIVNTSDIGEISIQEKDFKLRIRHLKYQGKAAPVAQPMMSAPMAPAAAPVAEKAEEESKDAKAAEPVNDSYVTIKSPMIGTFYRSPGPDKPPYIKVGDSVNKDDVLCIIEAMKLFNEIESEHSGKIVKVLVENESPVEYDQPLFLIDPNG